MEQQEEVVYEDSKSKKNSFIKSGFFDRRRRTFRATVLFDGVIFVIMFIVWGIANYNLSMPIEVMDNSINAVVQVWAVNESMFRINLYFPFVFAIYIIRYMYTILSYKRTRDYMKGVDKKEEIYAEIRLEEETIKIKVKTFKNTLEERLIKNGEKIDDTKVRTEVTAFNNKLVKESEVYRKYGEIESHLK